MNSNFVQQFNNVEYRPMTKLNLSSVLDGNTQGEAFIKRICWADRFPQGIGTARNIFDYNVLRDIVRRGDYVLKSCSINMFGYRVEVYENLDHVGLETLTIIAQ